MSEKKPKNAPLNQAKKAKQDEFYTQRSDIEKELAHYKPHFNGKTVLCNCDDLFESEFFRYFAINFNHLGLKKLIATSYAGSRKPYKAIVTKLYDITGDGVEDMLDIEGLFRQNENVLELLNGDNVYGAGDFRSRECIEFLKEADIVCTNPPFSLWREYISLLMEYKKQFLIIGNVNSATCKEIFPMIEQNKMWLGCSIHSGDREFRVPEKYPLQAAGFRVDENGTKYIRVKGVRWFTNLDYKQRHDNLILYKRYTPEEYPKYDNYNAIEVSKTAEIPCDYDGVIGVPITFLDKYNPDQFEILGITDRQNTSGLRHKKYTEQDDRNFNDLNARSVLKIGNKYKAMYARILIRNRHPEEPIEFVRSRGVYQK